MIEEQTEKEVIEALHILLALNDPEIRDTNNRRCEIIDNYLERGGDQGGYFTPEEKAELDILEEACNKWLISRGMPTLIGSENTTEETQPEC